MRIKRKSIAMKPIQGGISDTLNVEDKIKNAPSINLVEQMTGIPTECIIQFDGTEDEIPEGYEKVEYPSEVEIIENENGTAIKYPDGRMECSHFVLPTGQGDFTNAYGNVFLSTAGTIIWDYPQEFIAPPHVVAIAYFQGGVGGTALASKPTTTQVSIYPWHTKSYTFPEGSYGCEFIAKGYWK